MSTGCSHTRADPHHAEKTMAWRQIHRMQQPGRATLQAHDSGTTKGSSEFRRLDRRTALFSPSGVVPLEVVTSGAVYFKSRPNAEDAAEWLYMGAGTAERSRWWQENRESGIAGRPATAQLSGATADQAAGS